MRIVFGRRLLVALIAALVALPFAIGTAAATTPVLADSLADFSGVQGANGWHYGYYSGALTSATFTEMRVYDGVSIPHAWYVNPATYWTQLWADGGHPNSGVNTSPPKLAVEQWAVRRWVSSGSGTVTLAGNYAQEPACWWSAGTIIHILVDGVAVWSQRVSTTALGSYSRSAVVGPGSTIDYAISTSTNNDFCDSTHFTATISGILTRPDTMPPVITVPADVTADATSPAGAAVSYSATATDDVSVSSFSCTPPTGSTFPIGDTTVICNAADPAGNTSHATFHVRVLSAAQQIASLSAYITTNHLGAGRSLAKKLQAVQTSLAHHQLTAACNQLDAFMRKVHAQSGKKLTPAQSIFLIAAAQRIEDAAGCRP